MGFGLNLGIPDPRQWKKQQVSKAVVDEERVSFSRSKLCLWSPGIMSWVKRLAALIYGTMKWQVVHFSEIKPKIRR